MTMPVFIPGIHINDNGELVIDADKAAEAGVKSIEFIEGAPTALPEEAKSHSAMQCYKADARIEELEVELRLARETIADLRDLAYNRAPKIAAEVESARLAEERKREADFYHGNMFSSDELVDELVAAKARITELEAQLVEAKAQWASPVYARLEKAEARAEAAETEIERLSQLITEPSMVAALSPAATDEQQRSEVGE